MEKKTYQFSEHPVVLLGTAADTQVTGSSRLSWDVGAAAVNSVSQTSTRRLGKTRSLAHKDTLQVSGTARAVQPQGPDHSDGAAQFPSSASPTLVPFKRQPLESSKSSDAMA